MSPMLKPFAVVSVMLMVSAMVIWLGLQGNEKAIIAEQGGRVAELARTMAVLKERVDTLEDRIQELRESQDEQRERSLRLEVEVLMRTQDMRLQTR